MTVIFRMNHTYHNFYYKVLIWRTLVLFQDPKLHSDTSSSIEMLRACKGLYPYIESIFNLSSLVLGLVGHGNDHFMLERTKFNKLEIVYKEE